MKKLTLSTLFAKVNGSLIIKDIIATTFWSSIGKSIGFLIPLFIAAWFGVTKQTDAFFFSYGLILFLSSIFAPVVESVIVPFIAEARSRNEDVGEFLGRILGLSGLGIIFLSVLLLVAMKLFLPVFTRFDPDSQRMTFILLAETIPLFLFLVWTSLLSGAMNAYRKFFFPALSPAFRAGLILLVILLLKNRWGVHAIAWGYNIGELFRLALLLLLPRWMGLFSLKISFQMDEKLRDFLKTSSFQVFGMIAVGLNPVIDKIMASWLKEGSVSLLEYADRLYSIPVTFFYGGFVVVLLSHLSDRYYKTQSKQRLRNDILRASKAIGLSAFFVMMAMAFCHEPITQLAFGRGKFPLEKLKEIRTIFLFLLGGLIPYAIHLIVVRGLIILKNTKALMRALFLKNAIKILLNLLLIVLMGLSGIALSTSITGLLTLLYIWYEFEKSEG